MPELRRDVSTGQWVIVASKRARRAHDMAGAPRSDQGFSTSGGVCPFCPGNEEETPPPIYLVGRDGSILVDTGVAAPERPAAAYPPWLLRVVPNRFPALDDSQLFRPSKRPAMFDRTGAAGLHEVLIETAEHDKDLWQMSKEQSERVVAAYAARERTLREQAGVAFVMIFRNHGRSAGASLAHPHSQIAATPSVPPAAALRFETAAAYTGRKGGSLYRDLVERELDQGERIIESYGDFTVLAPFASRLPFETWILPKRCRPVFSQAADGELADFSATLRRTLARLARALGDPPYNLVLYSAPVGREDDASFSWHLQIVPRVTTPAGFELGSGMSINIVRPEDAAAFLSATEPD